MYKYIALVLALLGLWASGFYYGRTNSPVPQTVVITEVEIVEKEAEVRTQVVYKDRVRERIVYREVEPDGTVKELETVIEKEIISDVVTAETTKEKEQVSTTPAEELPRYSVGVAYRDPWEIAEKGKQVRQLEAILGYRLVGNVWMQSTVTGEGHASLGLGVQW